MATNIYDYALPFVRKQTTIFDAYGIIFYTTDQFKQLFTKIPDYLSLF